MDSLISLATTFGGILASGLLSWWIAAKQTKRSEVYSLYYSLNSAWTQYSSTVSSLYDFLSPGLSNARAVSATGMMAGQALKTELRKAETEYANVPYYVGRATRRKKDHAEMVGYASAVSDAFKKLNKSLLLTQHAVSSSLNADSVEEIAKEIEDNQCRLMRGLESRLSYKPLRNPS